MALYEIAFRGECIPGVPVETVKASVGQLFRADAERVALLFSGRRLVLKGGLEAAAAERFRQAMAKAGAVAYVQETASVEHVELAPPPPLASVTGPRLQVTPRDRYMAAFVDVDAPDYPVAEPGALMQPQAAPVPPPPLDLSRLSLAPAGADLVTAEPKAVAVVPDVSHLKMVP
ncbi:MULTISPECIES: hypothetical protein [Pseudomonas]|uniref:Uncharacterized protein n=1 Tax=Pseudomonas quercus TaxID=2722792 RepID=A0ABX0Y9B8_9PSED|nr:MULTISPECIES: hypothetical protein [Pseudomonas]MBF7141386.1 hypothetical protein [Pseudomonas sp. LY10J]NJO99924.1 hypothetical protein [Pseudomonas quercus]